MRRHGARILLAALLGLAVAAGLAPEAAAQPVIEATQAQTDDGTLGYPFFVSPRRLANYSGLAGGFDATAVDAVTWSDGANASNVWTFDVSGTDPTITFGNALVTFNSPVVFPSFTLGATAVTASGAELNFVDGVTSAIQTQLDAKIASAALNEFSELQTQIADEVVLGAGQTLVSGVDTHGGVSVGATETIDRANGWYHRTVVGEAVEFTYTASTDLGSAQKFIHDVVMDGTGGWAVTWASGDEPSSGAPPINQAANAVTRLIIVTYDGGTTWDVLGGGSATSTFLPIEWAQDGAAAPDAAESITTNNKTYRVRKFASDADDIVTFNYHLPYNAIDADPATAGFQLKVRPEVLITETTEPASGEGVSFGIAAFALGSGDSIDGTYGTEVNSEIADLDAHADVDYVQFPFVEVTITGAVPGEWVQFYFDRDTADTDDDYGQKVGVLGIVVAHPVISVSYGDL